MDQAALTERLRRLGCPDPEAWAKSQIEEGIPQLARYVFLRQAWKRILDENDHRWIGNVLQNLQRSPDSPYAGQGHALKRLRELGARDEDLTDLVRGAQAELLFDFCLLLEDPGELEEEISGLSWALVELDSSGRVRERIGGLHESVLQTDPTGREMSPRASKP
jgi:hypothetical protein